MNQIQIQKLRIKHTTYKWLAKGNIAVYDTEIQEYETILEKDLSLFKENLKEEKENLLALHKFDENDKVFFHSSVTFSRSKFRELFPKTKVTYSMENADAVIIDKDNYIKSLRHYWRYFAVYPASTNTGDPDTDYYCDSNDSPYVDQKNKNLRLDFLQIKEDTGKTSYIGKENIAFINLIISKSLKLVDVDSIALKSDLVMDDDIFTRIHQLLKSNNPANMQLACSMLSGFDYEQSHPRMALLLKLNWTNWELYSDKKTFIDLKTVLRRLHKQYPYLQESAYSHKNTLTSQAFWYNLFSNNYDDNIIHAYFHDWVNSQMNCTENNIEFLLRIKGKEDIFAFELSSNFDVEERIKILNQKTNELETNAEGGTNQEVEIQVPGELSAG